MIILNQVQVNLIYNTNSNLFLQIEIFISITDLYNTTVDRWSCHLSNRNKTKPETGSSVQMKDLEVTYALHLQLVGKPVNDFLFIIIMAALCNTASHYIFALWFLSSSSSIFFSSPNLSCRRLDVYHTSTYDVALVRIQNAGVKCAASGSLEIQDEKIAILAPSNNFVGLYLRN